jgi:hypothetical protein
MNENMKQLRWLYPLASLLIVAAILSTGCDESWPVSTNPPRKRLRDRSVIGGLTSSCAVWSRGTLETQSLLAEVYRNFVTTTLPVTACTVVGMGNGWLFSLQEEASVPGQRPGGCGTRKRG